jgi:adenylosuccinate lyase
VQRNAMKTWLEGADFLASLKSDEEVSSRIPAAQLEEMFDLGYHFKHVDTIFERVFGA